MACDVAMHEYRDFQQSRRDTDTTPLFYDDHYGQYHNEDDHYSTTVTAVVVNQNPNAKPKKAQCGKCGVCLILLVILGAVLAVAGGLMFIFVDEFIRAQVKEKVIISNTSETYEIWQDVPVPVYMQFYVFNIDNPNEVRNGKSPVLRQIGPFTYRERRVKFDLDWNDNGTVTYRQNRTFSFIRDMSIHDDNFQITTINPLIATIAQDMKFWSASLQKLVSWVLGLFRVEEDIIMTRPAVEIIFGYDDPALMFLNGVNKELFPMIHIGYFIRKNYTDDGVYTVMTGKNGTDKLGLITEYDGSDALDIWTTTWANMINGTDGTFGPPFLFDAEELPVFVSDICRSIKGIYKEDVETPQGIKLRRFGGDRRDMYNASINPDNIGFCIPKTDCLPTGLLNSTLCQEPVNSLKLPVIFSFPHFLYADPKVQQSVIGLKPVEEEHQTVIDTEPWTGLVLQVAKRLQINMYVQSVPNIEQTHKIQSLFFPVLWLNESSVVNDHWANKLKDELFTPMKIANYGKYGLVALGCAVVLLCSSLLTWRWRQQTKMVQEETDPILFHQDKDLTYDKPVAAQQSQPLTTTNVNNPDASDEGTTTVYQSTGPIDAGRHSADTLDGSWYDPASPDGDWTQRRFQTPEGLSETTSDKEHLIV